MLIFKIFLESRMLQQKLYDNRSNYKLMQQKHSVYCRYQNSCNWHERLRGSVAKCSALAINIRLFGSRYGRTALSYTVHKIYGFLVPLYGCTVKNTAFWFSALKTDFLKLSWLEVWFFFVVRNFGQRVRVGWWSVEATQKGDNVDLIIPNSKLHIRMKK